MTPQELDAQSPVKIDRWVEVYSEECKMIDDGLHHFTLKCIKIGFDEGAMFTDSLGRIWAKWGPGDVCHPFHAEYGNKLIGYRLSSKAAN